MRHVIMSLISVFFILPSATYALNVGEKAPLFHAESTQGTVSLESYIGKKHVVLAFYFADFTPV